MKKIRSICIIHRQEDNVSAIYFREFVKWIGLAYFDFIYHEINEELNCVLEQGNNHFDIILYINDSNKLWRDRYEQYADVNINVSVDGIWKCSDDEYVLDKSLLYDLWEDICSNCENDLVNIDEFKSIMKELIDIYCEYDLCRKLFNNRFTIRMKGDQKKENREQLQSWIKAIDEMDQWKADSCISKDITEHRGMEYFDYALLNSKRKVNEICNLLGARKAYKTRKMLEDAEAIYLLDEGFYMIESLRTKMARIDYEYKTMAISIDKVCINDCDVDSCNSFNYYRLGKLYEMNKRKEQSYKFFRMSYEANSMNFRAVYKLAVERIRKEDPSGARSLLLKILEILQISADSKVYTETYLKMPPLELEYVCKCYVLLGNIEMDFNSNHVNAEYYYRKATAVSDYVNSSTFLNKMYPVSADLKNVKECLSARLTLNSIQKKLASY